MKRIFLFALTIVMVLALWACASAPAAQAPAAIEAPAEPEAAPEAAHAAPETAPAAPETAPDAVHFVVSYEDGTPVPDVIEAKTGEENMLKLFFAIENGDGMVGWDRAAFEELGIHSDMSFAFIDEKGLMVTAWAEKATECKMNFFINGSDDWANPEILYEQPFAFVFSD